jgi:hypothetical protein
MHTLSRTRRTKADFEGGVGRGVGLSLLRLRLPTDDARLGRAGSQREAMQRGCTASVLAVFTLGPKRGGLPF